ncbi:MAG: LysR family transcriptional regulator [Alphaproteobacteria bacterium]|nr:MAG: LysR family transcriptional regulator [Alphaproteobacteria bacterium]
MRLEWLEDILAVIDTGSIRAAAERRAVTQPAFSRRLRAIEARLGVELFDRSRKPVVVHPAIAARAEEFRQAAAALAEMTAELRRAGRARHGRLVIASQHAMTATLVPGLVAAELGAEGPGLRLRTANREDCLALLMTRQADVMIGYQTMAEAAADPGAFLERAALGTERLVPVATPALAARVPAAAELPVIAYPADAFLGRVVAAEIQPRLGPGLRLLPRVETALTLAGQGFARRGIGIAWLPAGVARADLDDGTLVDLSDVLPATRLSIVALRLALDHGPAAERLWQALCRPAASPAQGGTGGAAAP